MTSFSASEMCQMIQEQLDFKLNELNSAEEKVRERYEFSECISFPVIFNGYGNGPVTKKLLSIIYI